MSWELVYTSVRRGLRPNTSGFCTVAVTAGMSRAVMQTIERISAYEFHFGLSDPRANENPINYLHMLLPVGGKPMHLLSRIAYAGADYSGRTNKIAHHILLLPDELSPAGPADMIRQLVNAGRFCSTWSGEPRELAPSSLAAGLGPSPAHGGPPATWRSLTGDAGWAGMLVKGFRENARIPAYLLFEPGLDILQLYQESLALLPPELRWEVGFSTYYYANLLPADSKVHWRAVVSGSPLARTEVTKYPNAVVLDLTHPLGSPPANLFVTAAREGHPIEPASPAPAQPQGRHGGASIDISQALNRRQTEQVPIDLLISEDNYEAQAPQQPSPALQPALADFGYQDDSLRSLRVPRRASRWTWVFAVAAFLLLLSNVTALLLLIPERTPIQNDLAAQLAAAKAAKREQARLTTLLDETKAEAKTAKDQLTTKLTDATQKAEAKERQLQDANSKIQELERELASAKKMSPGAASTPGPAAPTPPTPQTSAPDSLAKRIPFDYKTSWNGDLPSGDSDLSPPLAPEGISLVQVKDATTIFDPRGRIADYIYLKVIREGNEPNAVFYVKDVMTKVPDYTRPLVTCWLEDRTKGRFLCVAIPKNVSNEDAILRDSLVILLASSDGKLYYRCPLLKTSPVEVSLKVGPDRTKVENGVITFNYKCPDDLELLLSNETKTRKLRPNDGNQPVTAFEQTDALVIQFPDKQLTDRKHIKVTLLDTLDRQTTKEIENWTKSLKALLKNASMSTPVAAQQCIMDSNTSLTGAIAEEEKHKRSSKKALEDKQHQDADDRKWIKEYENELEALDKIKKVLDTIEEKRKKLRAAINGKEIEFRDPSGHIVQKITLKVIWGDNGKKK